MATTLSEALLVSTSWNTASDDLTSQPTRTLVKDFCEITLKFDEVSKLYCTVLDVEVSEDEKKDAESVGVTLIPATRSKWSDPTEDQPTPTWLLNHDKYYPGLKELKHIKYVVSFSSKSKNAAAAIHESLFPQAQFHQLSPPEPNGVLFTFDVWSKDACGLAGYHRAIIQDFCVRKGRAGELLKVFSTVLNVKLTEDQKKDAEKCGVTLIPAQEEKKGTKKKDSPNVDWLLKHEIHYPGLGKLENIKYVVGYAPKTGWAAADIRERLFPDAKLVLINHVCPEKNCLLENSDEEDPELEEEMLNMASAADVLFSIGPTTYEYFRNAFRANIDGKQLSDIPHEEVLPKPGQIYFDCKPVLVKDIKAHSLLTYGQLDSLESVKRCTSIAAAIGTVAKNNGAVGKKLPEWKICGVSKQDSNEVQEILTGKMQSNNVLPKLYQASSVPTLLRSIQQSHLCLPPSCYTDYSFEGFEAMAAGLPTTVQDKSHIAAMIEKHFEEHKDYCVVTDTPDNLAAKITKNLIFNIEAFQNAKKLKEDLIESEAVTESLAKFASIFKEEGASETQDSDKKEDVANTAIKSVDAEVTTAGPSGISVRTYMETEGTTAVQPRIKSAEGVMQTTDTTAVQSRMSDEVGEDTEDTTALHPGISDRVGEDTEGTTALHSGISDRVGVDTGGTTAVQPGISDTVGVETAETTAMHNGISITETCTAVQSEIVVEKDMVVSENIKVQPVPVNFGETETLEDCENGGVIGKDGNETVKTVSSDLAGTSPLPGQNAITQNRGSGNFMVHVRLNEDSYHQLLKTSEEVAVNDLWKNCQSELDKNADTVIANEASQQTVNDICRNNFGKVTAISMKKDSLAISLNLPTLYNLYRVRHTSLSGSFPDSFEPLLITDKMREEADKVGLQLKLKATYDQARFDELELFFINRDGCGLKPVKVFDDVIEGKDAEEIHIDVHGEDTDQKSDTKVTEGVADRTPTEHRQSVEDIPSTSEMERTTLESQLKEAKEEKATLEERCKELTQKLERSEQALVSQRIENRVEREKLQSELEDKKKLINEFEDIVGELEHKLEHSEQRKSEEKGDGEGLKPVKVFDDVIKGKDAEEIHIDDEDTDQKSDTMITGTVDSTALEDIQSKSTLESQLKVAKEEKATLEEDCKEVTQKLESSEQSLVSQRIGKSTERGEREKLQSELEEEEKLVKKLDNTVEEFKHNLEHSSQKKQAQKDLTLMPQQPPQHHHEMSAGHMMQASAATGPPTTPVVYSKAQQMPYPTDQPHTQGTIMGQMIPQKVENQSNIQHTQKPKKYRSSPQGHLTSPHRQGQTPFPQEIETSATQLSGDWSVTLVNGQHQGQGQKFKLPSGLAFHRDKLVVCDRGNNIVQILNKDYTCDKVIGSFDGQFAKPFRPKSVAISHFNHYFILDDENKQIVVRDENGKIIQIITLPENIKVVFDIALMDDFVFVTLSLTSRDITRLGDRDDRLVKYTESGEYVTEVSGQTSVQTKFFWPVSVAVNSKNVIMVYDYGNGCIKCFDSNLNFLHQFGHSQLQLPWTGSEIDGYGYIAVDEDDNVYVCGYVRVHSTGDVIREWIVKYGCDGKWICDLFKGRVSLPWCIAVMGDKIGVVEYDSYQIKVFSK